MRIIPFLLACTILSGCVSDPDGFLKRSSNGKYFDMSKSKKRRPKLNKPYIQKATENVKSGNLEEDLYDDTSELDSYENAALRNRQIYENLISDSDKKNKKGRSALFKTKRDSEYPNAYEANSNFEDTEDLAAKRSELNQELEQLQALIAETKQRLAKVRHDMVPNEVKSKPSREVVLHDQDIEDGIADEDKDDILDQPEDKKPVEKKSWFSLSKKNDNKKSKVTSNTDSGQQRAEPESESHIAIPDTTPKKIKKSLDINKSNQGADIKSKPSLKPSMQPDIAAPAAPSAQNVIEETKKEAPTPAIESPAVKPQPAITLDKIQIPNPQALNQEADKETNIEKVEKPVEPAKKDPVKEESIGIPKEYLKTPSSSEKGKDDVPPPPSFQKAAEKKTGVFNSLFSKFKKQESDTTVAAKPTQVKSAHHTASPEQQQRYYAPEVDELIENISHKSKTVMPSNPIPAIETEDPDETFLPEDQAKSLLDPEDAVFLDEVVPNNKNRQ